MNAVMVIFKDRLKKARSRVGMTQERLAEQVGVTRGAVAQWETGRATPDIETLNRIASATNTDARYLLGTIVEPNQYVGPAKAPLPNRQIPIVGQTGCGLPMLAEEYVEGYISLPEEILPPGQVIAIRVVGNSMERARLRDGDLALVKVQDEVENGEIAAVNFGEDRSEGTIKRYRRVDGFIMLMPDSDDKQHRPTAHHEEQIHIVGKVAGVWWG